MKIFVHRYSKTFLLATALIITIGNFGLNQGFSQTTTDNSGNQQSPTAGQSGMAPIQQDINWNQSLVNDPANFFCNENGECGGIVEVAFESNNTIALESFNSHQIFKTADMMKNIDGFQIIDVSTTPQDESIKYLVVMSK